MFIEKRNPFYLKFFTCVEGFLHVFIAPILIFYVSNDIKISGLFFLIDGLFKFATFSISGGIVNQENVKSVFKYSHFSRFLFALLSLAIFHYAEEDKLFLLCLSNLGFTISNVMFVSSIESLFQNTKEYSKDVQSLMTSGELLSSGLAVFTVFTLSYFKISFKFLFPIYVISFAIGLLTIHKLVENLRHFEKIGINKIFKNGTKEIKSTICFIKNSPEMITNLVIGYVPLAFFTIIEQTNIYKFSDLYSDETMKVLHFSFKTIWFLTGAFLVPLVIGKFKAINNVFVFGCFLFLIGGILSLASNTVLNMAGALLLGYSHNLIFVFRKVNRKRILDNSNIGFQSLGVFFAVEGLSSAFGNVYLSIFGRDYIYLLFLFGFSCLYLARKCYLMRKEESP